MRAIDGLELLQQYGRDGYAVLRRAVAPHTLDEARGHLDRLRSGPSGPGPLVTAPLEQEPFFLAFAAQPSLMALASLLLAAPGRATTTFGCTYVVKAARSGPPALWHQDGHPWRTALGITRAITLWIALDDTHAANGCLQVIPGSQRGGGRPLQPNNAVPNLFGQQLDPMVVARALAASPPVDLELRAGDVSAHHPDLIHGSPANRSDRERRALVIRYRAG